MALPNSIRDLEKQKFVEDASSNVAVRTVGSTSAAVGGVSQASGLAVYYAKPSGTNADGTSAYASATTLTVTGLPFTFTEYDIESIEQIPTSGDSTVYSDKTDFAVSSGTITVTGAAFAATDEFVVKLTGPVKGYDSASTAHKGFNTRPPWSHHDEVTLADVTNETSATNYYYFDMDGYQYFSVDVNTGGTAPTDTITITVEAGNQDDGTAQASIFYTDVTSDWFGVASVVDEDLRWEKSDPTGAKYVRIKTVTAGGSNDQDYAIYLKKW